MLDWLRACKSVGKLRFHFVERLQVRLLVLLHLQDVVAVGRFHEAAGLARLQ